MTEKLLSEQLANAEAHVLLLKLRIQQATCREIGCDMQHVGGANCGCDDGACSVPVYACTRCGAPDYGENEEAARVRRECAEGSNAAIV